jgi:hypothetical protein
MVMLLEQIDVFETFALNIYSFMDEHSKQTLDQQKDV